MELLRLIFVLLMTLVTVTAVLLALTGFFPRFTEQSQAVVERSPGQALVVGLVNFFFLGTIILTLMALGQRVAEGFFIPALVFLTILVSGVAFGLPGPVLLLGERLWPDKRPVVRHTYAAVLLVLACFAPLVGWFALLPVLSIIALGSCVLTLVARWQQERET